MNCPYQKYLEEKDYLDTYNRLVAYVALRSFGSPASTESQFDKIIDIMNKKIQSVNFCKAAEEWLEANPKAKQIFEFSSDRVTDARIKRELGVSRRTYERQLKLHRERLEKHLRSENLWSFSEGTSEQKIKNAQKNSKTVPILKH